MVEENVSPLGGIDDVEPKALFATAEGAECKVFENGLPTEPGDEVGIVKGGEVNVGEGSELGNVIKGRSPEVGPDS